MTLEGRNILVTGASQGIGSGCAIQLAQAGANVGINYRSHPEAAEQVAAEIRDLGRKAVLLPCDVSDLAAVEQMFKDFVGELGQLDGAVSNAAYSDRESMVKADMAGFERTINVTMWGAFHCVRTAAKTMVAQGKGGSIVVIGSPHAVIPVPSSMAYNMAKAAIDHMTRTAAIELAPDRIRVNVVHPGWIDTPGERKFFSEDDLAEGAKRIPWGRLGQPEEIGRLVAFVMSDTCDYMTGSTLLMDGGVSLPWGPARDEEKS